MKIELLPAGADPFPSAHCFASRNAVILSMVASQAVIRLVIVKMSLKIPSFHVIAFSPWTPLFFVQPA